MGFLGVMGGQVLPVVIITILCLFTSVVAFVGVFVNTDSFLSTGSKDKQVAAGVLFLLFGLGTVFLWVNPLNFSFLSG